MKSYLAIIGCLLGVALTSAQDYSLKSSVVGLGGGRSSGGDFAVTAVIGQFATEDLAGGDFTLSGGVQTPHAPVLKQPSVSITVQSGTIRLFWPIDQPGYVVETRSNLTTVDWRASEAAPVVQGEFYVLEVPLTEGSQFYRLKR